MSIAASITLHILYTRNTTKAHDKIWMPTSAFKPSCGASNGVYANSLRLTRIRGYFAFSIRINLYYKSTYLVGQDAVLCGVEVLMPFEEMYCFHLQGRRVRQANYRQEVSELCSLKTSPWLHVRIVLRPFRCKRYVSLKLRWTLHRTRGHEGWHQNIRPRKDIHC
jgi:hypothetical protein